MILLLVVAPVASAAPVTFTGINADGAGEGFNDPTLGASRTSAFNYALSILGSMFDASHVGETINVRAEFNPQGGGPSAATLGSAGPSSLYLGVANEPVPNVFYPTALTNHLEQGNTTPDTFEISIVFNSDVDNATVLGNVNWYYGTDAMPGAHVDLVTVALHELGHGLGFIGFFNSDGSFDGFGAPPQAAVSIYDHFMNTSATAGTKLTNLGSPTLTDPDAARAAEANGNDLYWDGTQATAANGGTRPQLYAPASFSNGSSLYHLNEANHGGELMSPFYSGPDHAYSLLEQGMLADMGWTIAAVPEAGAWACMAVAAASTGVSVILRRARPSVETPKSAR